MKLLQKAEESLTDSNNYDSCIQSAKSVLTKEPYEANVRFTAFHYLCKCYTADSQTSLAIDNCKEALKIRKEPGVFCDSAEAYLAAEMFDDGNI